MDDSLWQHIGAKSKRPDLNVPPVQEPMRSGLKPAEQKAPSTDQKRMRRRWSKTSSTPSTEESTMQTEATLLQSMASATTLAEQQHFAGLLTEFRNRRRDQISAEASIDFGAMMDSPVGEFTLPPVHAGIGVTSDSDWLGEMEVSRHDDGAISVAMRAEATLWYQGLPGEVKADSDEFAIQTWHAAQRSAAQFGLQRNAAASVFATQVDHLHRHAFDEVQPPPYDQPEGSSLPVGVDNDDTFDNSIFTPVGPSDQTTTDIAAQAPSLTEGTGTEQGQQQGIENPIGDGENDAATQTGYTDPLPSGGRGAAKIAINCSCAQNDDGTVTTMLCPMHADNDPCLTMAAVTGRRRNGTIRNGVCTACGWSSGKTAAKPGEKGYQWTDEDERKTYAACPSHPGQSYNKSTGDCSCGSNHNRWANSNNPDGYTGAKDASFRPVAVTGSQRTAKLISVREEYDDKGTLTLWSGSFASDYEGSAEPLQDESNGRGYLVTPEYGPTFTVYCPWRADATFTKVDAAIQKAWNQNVDGAKSAARKIAMGDIYVGVNMNCDPNDTSGAKAAIERYLYGDQEVIGGPYPTAFGSVAFVIRASDDHWATAVVDRLFSGLFGARLLRGKSELDAWLAEYGVTDAPVSLGSLAYTQAVTMHCDRCSKEWSTKAQYNLKCPECGAEESIHTAGKIAEWDQYRQTAAEWQSPGGYGYQMAEYASNGKVRDLEAFNDAIDQTIVEARQTGQEDSIPALEALREHVMGTQASLQLSPVMSIFQALAEGSGWLDTARQVVENKQYDSETGLDLFSASTMLQIYDGLNEKNQARFAGMPLAQAQPFAFKLVEKMGGTSRQADLHFVAEMGDSAQDHQDAGHRMMLSNEMTPGYAYCVDCKRKVPVRLHEGSRMASDPKSPAATSGAPSLADGDTPAGDQASAADDEWFDTPLNSDGGNSTFVDALPTGGTGDAASGPVTKPYASLSQVVHSFRDAAGLSETSKTLLEGLERLSSLDQQIGGVTGHKILALVLDAKDVPVEGKRRLVAAVHHKISSDDASTCSVCGDAIAKDPSGEDNSTWHHDNGETHDHEAKPGKESRRQANLYTGKPHPDYPDMVWSEPSVEGLVLPVIEKATSPDEAAVAIIKVLDSVGYDSMDREMAFWIASQTKGWSYDDIYDAWLNNSDFAAGKFNASKTAKTAASDWQVGDVLERDGKRYQITRITPPGAAGTSYADGPVYHATVADESGQAISRGFTADVWTKSMSYPTSAYTKVSTREGRTPFAREGSEVMPPGSVRVSGKPQASNGTFEAVQIWSPMTAERIYQGWDYAAAMQAAEAAVQAAKTGEWAAECASAKVFDLTGTTAAKTSHRTVTASGPSKAIAIYPDKTVKEITVSSLEDMQAVVQGYIEPVDLSDGVTMYVNEEGLYKFTKDDVNWIAADVAGLGGQPQFMFGRPPLLGPVLLVGFNPESGDTADIPEVGRRWVKRVGREAGAKWAAKTSSRIDPTFAARVQAAFKVADGRYAPTPEDPFRWLEAPRRSPEYSEFKRVFPNGVPMRDEDLTPEQKAFLDSGKAFSSKQAGGHGSGWGDFRSGAPVSGVADVSVGDLLLNDSSQFGAKNVVRVTRVDEDRGLIYGVFADPSDPSVQRMGGDQEFAIWDFMLINGEYTKVGSKTAEVGDRCDRCEGKGWVKMVWRDDDGEVMRSERDCPDCGGSSKNQEPSDYPLSDDPIYDHYASQRVAMPNPADLGVTVGSFFVSSWGYDQTNIDYYQVTALTGASVRVRPVQSKRVDVSGQHNGVIPVKDAFTGPEFLKRIQSYTFSGEPRIVLSLNTYSNAYLWDGKVNYETDSMFGH